MKEFWGSHTLKGQIKLARSYWTWCTSLQSCIRRWPHGLSTISYRQLMMDQIKRWRKSMKRILKSQLRIWKWIHKNTQSMTLTFMTLEMEWFIWRMKLPNSRRRSLRISFHRVWWRSKLFRMEDRRIPRIRPKPIYDGEDDGEDAPTWL